MGEAYVRFSGKGVKGMVRFSSMTALFALAFTISQVSTVRAASVSVDPTGYALFSANGSLGLNNLSTITINGNARSQTSTCTFNNLSTFTLTGSVVCLGDIKFNNISSGSVSGVVQSTSKVTIPKGFRTGVASVVNSISSLYLSNLSAPSGTSDANYLLPITIITGDYQVTGPVTLNGTIYATGDIHINNGSISGSGSLVAGGGIHINNISTVGSTSANLFLYALGASGIDANNVSSLTVRGSLYAPAGRVKLDNISSLNVTAGIFGDSVSLNNISTLTIGPGSLTSSSMPPGITHPVTPPAAPSNLVASSASFTSVNLAWTDNSNNETNFLIERSNDGTTFTQVASVVANTSSYVDSSLPTNATYWYRVRANNSAGNSTYTNIASATLLSPPNSPSNLVASVAANGTDIGLTWTDNSTNEATFRIERSSDGTSFTEIGSVSANITSYTDSGLSAGTFTYRVRAQNAAGNSNYSNSASGTIEAASPLECDSTVSNSGYNSSDDSTYLATVAQCGLLYK